MEEEIKNKMSEEKFKRIVVAITVGSVLLLFILLSVMVYQVISIFSLKKQVRETEDAIAYYTALAEAEDRKFEYYSSSEYWKNRAEKLGIDIPDGLD